MKKEFSYKTIVQHCLAKKKKLQFAFIDELGDMKNVSWKEWRESDLRDESSDFAKNMMKSLVKDKARGEIGFSRLIMLNEQRCFRDVMNFLEREGVKVNKSGMKIN
tara:strand:- start:111 stop:428 length:318 start_codon:yes stop_codon:yes gene_type:complete